jgi:hypothetical protein
MSTIDTNESGPFQKKTSQMLFAHAPPAAVGFALVGVALGPEEGEEPVLHAVFPVPLRRIALQAGRPEVLENQVAAGVPLARGLPQAIGSRLQMGPSAIEKRRRGLGRNRQLLARDPDFYDDGLAAAAGIEGILDSLPDEGLGIVGDCLGGEELALDRLPGRVARTQLFEVPASHCRELFLERAILSPGSMLRKLFEPFVGQATKSCR